MTTRSARSRTRTRYRRWSPADKTKYLALFRRSRQSVRVFCARVDVPRSTFELWRREARQHGHRTRAGRGARFARVEVVGPGVTPLAAPPALVVRAPNGMTLELTGLDAGTLVTLLWDVLGRPTP